MPSQLLRKSASSRHLAFQSVTRSPINHGGPARLPAWKQMPCSLLLPLPIIAPTHRHLRRSQLWVRPAAMPACHGCIPTGRNSNCCRPRPRPRTCLPACLLACLSVWLRRRRGRWNKQSAVASRRHRAASQRGQRQEYGRRSAPRAGCARPAVDEKRAGGDDYGDGGAVVHRYNNRHQA